MLHLRVAQIRDHLAEKFLELKLHYKVFFRAVNSTRR